MKLIIDIPEELKQKIDEGFTNQVITNKLWDATKNGTPIPENGNNGWTPITTRPMTEEEKEHFKEYYDYEVIDDDDARIFNCRLPEDGEEVLITIYGGVETDTFVQDDGTFYFEGRDIEDVKAWMPLPDPYKE